jgi:hypothetical protein
MTIAVPTFSAHFATLYILVLAEQTVHLLQIHPNIMPSSEIIMRSLLF